MNVETKFICRISSIWGFIMLAAFAVRIDLVSIIGELTTTVINLLNINV